MAQPGLIRDYLAELAACLPAGIVEELADGLDQTSRHYLDQGLDQVQAARAAIALPTRVDIVRRGRRRPGLGPHKTGDHSCGTAPEWLNKLHRLR